MLKSWKAVCFLPVLALTACGPRGADNDGGEAIQLAAPIVYTDAEKAEILKTFPAPYDTADLAAGEKQFNKCRACHTITPDGMNMSGPHLFGVFGRKAATAAGYPYSEAMRKHAVVWDYATLDTFLTAPQATVKGTKMGYPGIKDDTDRRNLIAYIRLMSAPKAGAPVSAESASAAE
ncbi:MULTISPECIES: cytochrome c family protein [Asticcacaulis]|uniref:c-type cytochrome n=1 Tax=Asticcacaulis TaxID=76890 RepID=UPI001AE2BE27|nr:MULTISPECIES: cytochrome c family protein [Asticcacaulis]MBP2158802.1 cytochrome c [Asticcacaulis solisilvae]MDR6799848.1 cytochrome c [Asticcacaulis sp. BE141]